MAESEAYYEGEDAYWSGGSNPYKEGSREREDWHRGYSDACAKDEEVNY